MRFLFVFPFTTDFWTLEVLDRVTGSLRGRHMGNFWTEIGSWTSCSDRVVAGRTASAHPVRTPVSVAVRSALWRLLVLAVGAQQRLPLFLEDRTWRRWVGGCVMQV